jgi:hypothetical protein
MSANLAVVIILLCGYNLFISTVIGARDQFYRTVQVNRSKAMVARIFGER